METAVLDDQPPAFLVGHAVVAAAEQDQVVELGLAAIGPVRNVMLIDYLDRLTLALVAHMDRIVYLDLKSGNDRGSAWIGRVRTSKTGMTLFYRRRVLRRQEGISGNHVDVNTGEEFWVSGVKKDRTDRRAVGSPVNIDNDVLEEYLQRSR